MDCVTAQQLISEAMDRQPVEAGALAQAKEHCRDCAECARFVRGQLLAKQAPLPAPPTDLADRIMAAVRAEAEAAEVAEQAGIAAAEAAAAAEALPPEPLATLAPPEPRRRKIKLPRTFAIATIAAVLLVAVIGAGAVAIMGIKQLSPKTAGPKRYEISAAQTPAAAPNSASKDTAASGGASGTAAAAADLTGPGPHLITVNGVVYSLVGPAAGNVGPTSIVGATTNALGGGKTPVKRDVLGGVTPDIVYVTDDSDRQLAFTRVTRKYVGLNYVLTAAEITDFGQWPSLPAEVAAPKAPDGSPTFLYVGTDPSGVKIYRLTASPVTSGVGIEPTGDSSGAMSGDPNWSWWAAAR
jgi:hypothetical protein